MIKKQLKVSDIAPLSRSYAAAQKYRCPVCTGPLASGQTALDHSHTNGHIRGLLCRSCNVGEGKVKAGAHYMTHSSNLAKTDYIQWLRNLANYLEWHEKNPTGLIHPTFDLKTGKQKPVKRKKRI